MLVLERSTTKVDQANIGTEWCAVVLGAATAILSIGIAILRVHEQDVFRLEIGMNELHTMTKTNCLNQLISKAFHVVDGEAQMMIFFAEIIK
jgi:hypothetical protein